jgi:LmbE family N-acetylglucosaminyl deacetylase
MPAPSATLPLVDPVSKIVAPLGTILSVWAHPDDETYLAAGVMAAAAERGQRVVCASMTAGELGTDDPEAWPPARLARVRRLEAAAAMAVLGVGEHRILDLPDGALADHDRAGVGTVEALLDEVAPDTVLTFGPDGMTFHPDHLAVHRWVTEAWERRRRQPRLLYAVMSVEHQARFGPLYDESGVYMTDERPTAVAEHQLALHLRLDREALDRKVAALRAMWTQTAALAEQTGPALFEAQAAEECFVDARALLAS